MANGKPAMPDLTALELLMLARAAQIGSASIGEFRPTGPEVAALDRALRKARAAVQQNTGVAAGNGARP